MFRVTVSSRCLVLMYLIFVTDFKDCGVWMWSVDVECGCGVWMWSVDVECGCGVWMWSDIYRYESLDLTPSRYDCIYSGHFY